MKGAEKTDALARLRPLVVAGLAVLFLWPVLSVPFWPVADAARLARVFAPDRLRFLFASFHPGDLYEPLSWLSYALDSLVWGTNSAGFHATGLALHAANAALLYLIGVELLEDRGWASAAALLFALHPMRVESIAWLSARPYLLSSFFSLICVLIHLRRPSDPGARRLGLAAFALALAAQPFAAGVPAVLLLLDRRAAGAGEAPETRPSLAGYWLILYLFAAVSAAGRDLSGFWSGWPALGFGAEAARAALAPARMLARTFWPAGLLPLLPQHGAHAAAAAACALGAAGASIFVWRRKDRGAAAAFLSFLALLIPYALFDADRLSRQPLRFADRWTYLPSAALALGLAAALRAAARRTGASRLPGRGWAWALVPLLLGPFAFRAARAWRAPAELLARNLAAEQDCLECATALSQSIETKPGATPEDKRAAQVLLRNAVVRGLRERGDWKALYDRGVDAVNGGAFEDGAVLLDASLAENPANADAEFEAGYAASLGKDLDGAIGHTRKAVALDPKNLSARNNLGFFLLQKKLSREAVAQFEEALKLDPANQLTMNNLAAARLQLASAGKQDWRTLLARGNEAVGRGKLDEGLSYLFASIAANPQNPDAHLEAGYAYSLKGDLDRAIPETQAALNQNPNLAGARNNLGFFLGRRGRYREAVEQFQTALSLAPGDQLARNNLAAAQAKLDLLKRGSWKELYDRGVDAVNSGAVDEGLVMLEASLAANPRDPDSQFETGYAYSLKGDLDRAIERTRASAALAPDRLATRMNLGFFLQQKGRYRDAAAEFREALRIAPDNAGAREGLTSSLMKASAAN